MDGLEVFVTYSYNYLPVYERFLESFIESELDESHLHVHTYELPPGAVGFQTATWYHALEEKMRYFTDQLQALPVDAVGLFVDADVQFFPNHDELQNILRRMRKYNLDLMFMREYNKNEVNGGVFFARNTEGAAKVLQTALVRNEGRVDPMGEQDVFNDILWRDSSIKWRMMDAAHVCWGPHLPRDWSKVIVHHAVCTKTMNRKIQQMDRIRHQWRCKITSF